MFFVLLSNIFLVPSEAILNALFHESESKKVMFFMFFSIKDPICLKLVKWYSHSWETLSPKQRWVLVSACAQNFFSWSSAKTDLEGKCKLPSRGKYGCKWNVFTISITLWKALMWVFMYFWCKSGQKVRLKKQKLRPTSGKSS